MGLKKVIRGILGKRTQNRFIRTTTCFFLLIFIETFIALDTGQSFPTLHYLLILGFYFGIVTVAEYLFSSRKWIVSQVYLLGGLLGFTVEQNFLIPTIGLNIFLEQYSLDHLSS